GLPLRAARAGLRRPGGARGDRDPGLGGRAGDQHPALLRTVPGAARCGDARLAAQQPPPRPHRCAEPGEERLDGGCADGPSRDDHELRHAPDAAQMGGRPGRRAARGRQPRGHRAVPGLGLRGALPRPGVDLSAADAAGRAGHRVRRAGAADDARAGRGPVPRARAGPTRRGRTDLRGAGRPPESRQPGPGPEDRRLTATLCVAQALRALAHAAELTAGGADGQLAGVPAPQRLREQAELLEQSVNRVFLDAERGCYRDPGSRGAAGYRQTSNLLPLAFGIVPPARVGAVVGNLVADIVARGDHHDCGHLGVRHLLPVLSAHGHGALAWRVLTAPGAPGWRDWLEAGNSTFMEMWESPRSCSHYFMGTPVTWIHEQVAGLRRGPDGWRDLVVAPDPDVPVGRIALALWMELGEVVVEVDREQREVTVVVPDGARAQLVLPGLTRSLGAGRHRAGW